MSTVISIIIFTSVIVVLMITWYKEKSFTTRPEFSENDFPLIYNDKSILIEGPNYSEVKEACMDFCKTYNDSQYYVIIRIIRINPTTCLLIFPYEINFRHYCFLINYLEYPFRQRYTAKVTGWLTSQRIDDWINNRSVNKKIMVYNHTDLNFSDGVNYTTMDQLGYRIDFTNNSSVIELEAPLKQYSPISIKMEVLNLDKGELVTAKSP